MSGEAQLCLNADQARRQRDNRSPDENSEVLSVIFIWPEEATFRTDAKVNDY